MCVSVCVCVRSPHQSEPGEQEQRDQAAKQERLDAAEAFDIKSQVADGAGGGAGGGGAAGAADQKKNESLMAGMIANIINNLQVTVRNIHLRYEDKLSTPDVGPPSPSFLSPSPPNPSSRPPLVRGALVSPRERC